MIELLAPQNRISKKIGLFYYPKSNLYLPYLVPYFPFALFFVFPGSDTFKAYSPLFYPQKGVFLR